MTYEKMLEKRCKNIDELTDFVDNTSILFYEKEEYEGITTVDVFCIDDNECSDLIESFEFDKNGNLIK